ncbi:LytR C-terminal domain-containing protein [Streptomyces sp. JJ66]|uniref:LytR C-terminal domain-containing protein n=1 Tax=Streptomyces sp. JJ66 TaxID=2803843 RepID=UPI001C5A57F3|nr:LytR C-terminal domain-containing protein [Streptomyces sp. JJ66]MBW1604490.1 LytR C-terminal domain-containing protein [Streptomyces sp. JJ66]
MSMLTPPGIGGEYRVTGDRYPRMRRRRRGRLRIVLGGLAAVTALGLLSWGTLQLVNVFAGNTPPVDAAHAAGCAPRPSASASAAPVRAVKVAQPAAVTVNVLNATKRTGLAQRTADQLKERGFTIGAVDNAPPELDGQVKAAGLLIGTPDAEAAGAFTVLGAHLAKTEHRVDAAREGDAATSVDLVIGQGFTALATPAEAARTVTSLVSPKPSPEPTPADC